jgi:hypothetical protein
MTKEKDPLAEAEKGLSAWLNSGLGQLVWKGFMVVAAVVGTILLIGIKGSANDFIAKSPAMIANTMAIQEAQAAVTAAKSTADTAAAKADQSLALSAKIFDAIKELNSSQQEMKVSIASSQATITAQVQDLGTRLTRIEAKQDAGH